MSLPSIYKPVLAVGCKKSNEGLRNLMYYSGTAMTARILSDGQIQLHPWGRVSLDDLEAEAATYAVKDSVTVDRSAKIVTFQPLP